MRVTKNIDIKLSQQEIRSLPTLNKTWVIKRDPISMTEKGRILLVS